jgi:hypothetical protein
MGREERTMRRKKSTMLRVVGWAGLAVGLIALGVGAASSPPAPGGPASEEPIELAAVSETAQDLVVHEWGTFLGMNGSDGTSLDGMYHEEHALPEFVHGRARDQLRMPMMLLKGETPVIYFYTPKTVQVRVGVDFPQGIWTHWYPQAGVVDPPLAVQAQSPDRIQNGRICWFAEVTPPSMVPADVRSRPVKAAGGDPALPSTTGDALWNFARDVDAAFVRTTDATRTPGRNEYERFLFYRGLGRAPMPMRAHAGGGGTIALEGDAKLGAGVRHIFVLRVEGGRGAYAYRPALGPGEQATGVIPTMDRARPLAEFTEAIADDLAAKLTESGLYAKEARAMVNTWKSSYFQTDGIRVLFVLPQTWTDSFIPMRILPKPKEVVRVMVGRLELLSAERERRTEAAVRDLASVDAERGRQAFAYLREQGRYVEPMLRRLASTTKDEGVRTLCRRLLLTGFVTDLRAAIHNAADGKRLEAGPLELRAQLARLYREMGMIEEAKAEANAVWQGLRERTKGPNALAEDNPYVLTVRAAIHEARGDDRRAAEIYAGLIEQYVKSLPRDVHPSTFTMLREAWNGRAYAGCLVRAGLADSTVASLQRKLDRLAAGPDGLGERRATGSLLGFLLEARGRDAEADVQWSRLASPPGLALGR